jgi:hypothetical protein
LVEEVEAGLAELDLDDWPEPPRYLDLVEEARNELHFDSLALPKEGEHKREAVAFAELTEEGFQMGRQVAFPLEHMLVGVWLLELESGGCGHCRCDERGSSSRNLFHYNA